MMFHNFVDGFGIFLDRRLHAYRGRSTTQCCEDFADPDYAPPTSAPSARQAAAAAGLPYIRGGIMELGGSQDPIAEGQIIKVFWRGKPIYISHRSKKEIDAARAVDVGTLPDPQPDQARVKDGKEQWLVVVGICTHLGCIPLAHQGNYDGWFCPCHGSQYDTSGRIRQGPAPANLPLPPYEFVSDGKIRIG